MEHGPLGHSSAHLRDEFDADSVVMCLADIVHQLLSAESPNTHLFNLSPVNHRIPRRSDMRQNAVGQKHTATGASEQ